MIRHLDSSRSGFNSALTALLVSSEVNQLEVSAKVKQVIKEVKTGGDRSLVELTNRFDGRSVNEITDLVVERSRLQQAFNDLDPLIADALKLSVERIERYHHQQLKVGAASWDYTDDLGNRVGQRVRAMTRVGLYVPGGKASYPSTV